jgi:AbrB family looped-hinge helix DNA binding protein
MLAELRAKSQITIPQELVDWLGLSEGDKLDIYEQDGMLCIMPVAVYPKKYLEELCAEVEATKIKISSGEQPVFDNVNALIACLEEG